MHILKNIPITLLAVSGFIPLIFAEEDCKRVVEEPGGEGPGCSLHPYTTFCYKKPRKYYVCCINRESCEKYAWI